MDHIPALEVVPLGWCVDAMYRSLERVREAKSNDPIGAYAAVAETLYWIHVVRGQLEGKFRQDYDATLAEQTGDVARMLNGLKFARNRITHEVDQVRYILATAKGPDGFDANWTWQSLPPRPGDNQGDRHRDYEAVIAGRDVICTLLTVTVFLGQARNRMCQHYGHEESS